MLRYYLSGSLPSHVLGFGYSEACARDTQRYALDGRSPIFQRICALERHVGDRAWLWGAHEQTGT